MHDVSGRILVRALTVILVSRDLTTEDKRRVSNFLDEEIVALVAAGHQDTEETAKLAVKEATKKLRGLQGVASITARKREERRRKWPQRETSPRPIP